MRSIALIVSFALGGSAAGSPPGSRPVATDLDSARAIRLTRDAQRLPDVVPEDAAVAVEAALIVESRTVPAELLVAIAWGESRFIPSTVTGRACGLLQVVASAPASCSALQIPIVGMLVGRLELEQWLALAHGDLHLALLGNACGMSALRGTCTKTAWPNWVLGRARWLGLDVGPRS